MYRNWPTFGGMKPEKKGTKALANNACVGEKSENGMKIKSTKMIAAARVYTLNKLMRERLVIIDCRASIDKLAKRVFDTEN